VIVKLDCKLTHKTWKLDIHKSRAEVYRIQYLTDNTSAYLGILKRSAEEIITFTEGVEVSGMKVEPKPVHMEMLKLHLSAR
jgi:hypothetical protein